MWYIIIKAIGAWQNVEALLISLGLGIPGIVRSFGPGQPSVNKVHQSTICRTFRV
jgi:hypothetical protein